MVEKGRAIAIRLADVTPGARFQCERRGSFCADRDNRPGASVFNRTAILRDTWAEVQRRA